MTPEETYRFLMAPHPFTSVATVETMVLLKHEDDGTVSFQFTTTNEACLPGPTGCDPFVENTTIVPWTNIDGKAVTRIVGRNEPHFEGWWEMIRDPDNFDGRKAPTSSYMTNQKSYRYGRDDYLWRAVESETKHIKETKQGHGTTLFRLHHGEHPEKFCAAMVHAAKLDFKDVQEPVHGVVRNEMGYDLIYFR